MFSLVKDLISQNYIAYSNVASNTLISPTSFFILVKYTNNPFEKANANNELTN